jgi:hypothetical protein
LARLDAAGIDESEFPAAETSGDSKLSKFTLTLGVWFLLGAKQVNARGMGSTVLVAKLLFVLITLFVAAIPVVGGAVYMWEGPLFWAPKDSVRVLRAKPPIRSGAEALHNKALSQLIFASRWK